MHSKLVVFALLGLVASRVVCINDGFPDGFNDNDLDKDGVVNSFEGSQVFKSSGDIDGAVQETNSTGHLINQQMATDSPSIPEEKNNSLIGEPSKRSSVGNASTDAASSTPSPATTAGKISMATMSTTTVNASMAPVPSNPTMAPTTSTTMAPTTSTTVAPTSKAQPSPTTTMVTSTHSAEPATTEQSKKQTRNEKDMVSDQPSNSSIPSSFTNNTSPDDGTGNSGASLAASLTALLGMLLLYVVM